VNRRWSAKRTRVLLRRLRSADLIERDPVARSLRLAFGTSTSREAVLAAIDRALPSDDAFRTSIMLVDVEGRSTKDAAAALHVVRRHFFRWRTRGLLRPPATVEEVLNHTDSLDVSVLADYTAGVRLWRHRTGPALTEAIRRFERARAHSSSHPARVLCGMAKAHLIRAEYLLVCARSGFDAAQELCDRAEEIDAQCAELFVVRADIAAFRDHDVARARNLIVNALSLDPQSRDALVFGAWHAAISGDTVLALDYVRDVLEIAPEAADARTVAGVVLHFADRFDEAVVMLRSVVETDPEFAAARYHVAASLACAGEYADALTYLDANREFASWQQFRALRYRCRLATGAAVLQSDLADLEPYLRAVAVLGSGDLEAGRAALASANAADCTWLPLLRGDPLLRELRGFPEFRQLTAAVKY
jgi:tetratricopeptide (TPR) repeat protein